MTLLVCMMLICRPQCYFAIVSRRDSWTHVLMSWCLDYINAVLHGISANCERRKQYVGESFQRLALRQSATHCITVDLLSFLALLSVFKNRVLDIACTVCTRKQCCYPGHYVRL